MSVCVYVWKLHNNAEQTKNKPGINWNKKRRRKNQIDKQGTQIQVYFWSMQFYVQCLVMSTLLYQIRLFILFDFRSFHFLFAKTFIFFFKFE